MLNTDTGKIICAGKAKKSLVHTRLKDDIGLSSGNVPNEDSFWGDDIPEADTCEDADKEESDGKWRYFTCGVLNNRYISWSYEDAFLANVPFEYFSYL